MGKWSGAERLDEHITFGDAQFPVQAVGVAEKNRSQGQVSSRWGVSRRINCADAPVNPTWVASCCRVLSGCTSTNMVFTAPQQQEASLSDHRYSLDRSRNHPTVPLRITAGTTMSEIATLSSKYKISIPKAVRQRHDWKPGQKFALLTKESGVLLVPVPSDEDLFGIAKGASIDNYRDRDDRY